MSVGEAGLNDFSAMITAIAERADRGAFAVLFNHFAPRVKSYLLRLGAGAEAAEELAQETLLTVWRRAASYDPAKAAASTWIFTIARNLRIDLIRRERRPELTDDPALVPEPEPSPDRALQAVQEESRIAAAMALLPPEQAEVIRLSFFSDKPHSEIAGVLNLPLGTVKSRVRLAMLRLRQLLEDPS
jgi:RNA polymerase sigma-70 factor (ECF subfamily)